MRNITVSADDEAYTPACVAPRQETDTERLKRRERELRSNIKTFHASNRLSREDLRDRCL